MNNCIQQPALSNPRRRVTTAAARHILKNRALLSELLKVIPRPGQVSAGTTPPCYRHLAKRCNPTTPCDTQPFLANRRACAWIVGFVMNWGEIS
jgi:hypothetical protein